MSPQREGSPGTQQGRPKGAKGESPSAQREGKDL